VFFAAHEIEASEFYYDGAYRDLKFAVYDNRSRGNADVELSFLDLLEESHECHDATYSFTNF